MASMTVTLKRLPSQESGKALAYLDPELMIQWGIIPGALLCIEGQTGPEGTTFRVLARAGFMKRSLRRSGGLELDELLFERNELPQNAKVHVTPLHAPPVVMRLVILASSALSESEQERCVDFLKRHRVPVNQGSRFVMPFSPARQVFLEVAEVSPLHGGVVAAESGITVLYKSDYQRLKDSEALWPLKRQREQLERDVQTREATRASRDNAVRELRQQLEASHARAQQLQEAVVQARQEIQHLEQEQQSQDARWEQALAEKHQELAQLEAEGQSLNVDKHQIKSRLDTENRQLVRDIAKWQEHKALLLDGLHGGGHRVEE
jgi:hypothetical protein